MTDALGELLEYLTPAEQAELDQHLVAMDPVGVVPSARAGVDAPADWESWLKALFPKHFYHAFGKRHEEFWSWVWGIEPESTPRPFIAIWPRESGKSTNAEAAVTALGCRGKRRYAVYIRITQDKADDSVSNIASLLESEAVKRHYPQHADRMLGKFGQSKGWRRNRVRTAGGFTVDALGLDVPVRGIKMEDQRPDLIIIDDCDASDDSPDAIAKKVRLITRAVLPAGAQNVAVLGAQNLISRGGVFTQLANGSADFLADRIVSGPYPAIEGLEYEWRTDAQSGVRYAHIIKGQATWVGQPLDVCQRNIRMWSLSAFLKEAQHKVMEQAEGVVLRFDASRHYIDLTDDEVRMLVAHAIRSKHISVFGGIDFGAWRFAFTLWLVIGDGADTLLRRPDLKLARGVVIRIDEYFGQRLPGQASLTERAQAIHETCEWYGIPVETPTTRDSAQSQAAVRARSIPIWGDAANPTDILEINQAFKRGWEVEYDEGGRRTVEHITSRLRVVPVAMENKLRKTSVDRINDMLDRNAVRYRREISYEWRYGMNANSEGTPLIGSRLMWEIDNWSYAIPKLGEEQDQDPDDATADGGDMMASKRYALMSVFGATKLPAELGVYPDDKAPPIDFKRGQMGKVPHAADDFLGRGAGRRMPAVKMPRPRTSR